MTQISKPPLVAAALRVTLPHNLKVAETRSSYYEDIKQTFPVILFPELKQITYDFSDCHFQNTEGKVQIRIATNYFSMETIDYKDVERFWGVFSEVFKKFAARMGVSEVIGLSAEFLNKISIDAGRVGTNFSDYFAINLVTKSQLSREFLTLDGAIIYRMGQDLLQLDIRPVQNLQTRLYDTLDFKITFLTNRKCSIANGLTPLKDLFMEGHKHVDDAFKTSLSEKYWQTIQ